MYKTYSQSYQYFQMGALAKMQSLRTLIITAYTKIRNFNFPNMLAFNFGLKNLWIKVNLH